MPGYDTLPVFATEDLDNVAIAPQVHQIRQIVCDHVNTGFKYDLLKAPQLQNNTLKPICDKIVQEHLNGGTLYSLLANVDQFQKESIDDPATSSVSKTRALCCEIICIKLLREYSASELAEALTFDFYPLSDGTPYCGRIPSWLRISAIELAINAECKHLLSHPSVVELIEALWDGRLTFDTYLNKSHRYNFNSREELGALVQSRKGIVHEYDFRDAGIFRLSRLRVPKYRALFKTFSTVGFLGIYFLHLRNQDNAMIQWLFLFYGVGFVLDETVYFFTVRPKMYLMSLWNICDMITVVLFSAYFVLLSQGAPLLARDILATMGITLVPRICAIFDANESFSKMLISVRQMSIDLGVSWLVVMIFSFGFWVSFAYSFSQDIYSPGTVAYEFVKIMFGYTGSGWEQWGFYRVTGKTSLLAYLFLTQFVVRPILTAVLSSTYDRVKENSNHEYHYLRTVNTISKLKTEAAVLFFFVPPLNMLEWVLYPTVWILPYHKFLVLNRTILKITHFPLLLGVFIYETLYWRVHSLTRHVQQKNKARFANRVASVDTVRPTKPIDMRRVHNGSMNSTRTRVFSQYAVLDELFNNPLLSVKYQGPEFGQDEGRGDQSYGSMRMRNSVDSLRKQVNTEASVEKRLDQLEEAARRIEKLLLELTNR